MSTYEYIVKRTLSYLEKDSDYIDLHDTRTFEYLKTGNLDQTFQFNYQGIQDIINQIDKVSYNDLLVINSKFRDQKFINEYIVKRNNGANSEIFITEEMQKANNTVHLGFSTVFLKANHLDIYEDIYYDEFKYKVGIPFSARIFIKIWGDFLKDSFPYNEEKGQIKNTAFKKMVSLALGEFVVNKIDFKAFLLDKNGIDLSILSNYEDNSPTDFNNNFIYDALILNDLEDVILKKRMTDIVETKSNLKVLIKYFWDLQGDDDTVVDLDTFKGKFSEELKAINKNFPEDIATEYLLIICQKLQNEYVFTSFCFDHKGLPTFTAHNTRS